MAECTVSHQVLKELYHEVSDMLLYYYKINSNRFLCVILTSAVDLSVCLSVDLQAALVLPRVGGWNAETGGAEAAGRYELV